MSGNRLLCAVVVLAAFALVAVVPASAAGFRPSVQGKKLIASGWHMPSAEYIRDHVSEMEKLPFDGLIFNGFYPFWTGFRGQQVALDQFVAAVQATKFQKFTDNFMGVESGNDGTFDWFDAAKVQDMVHNWGLIATAAHKAGLKGVKFDPECYEGPDPFMYDSFKDKGKTPEEYAAQAEQVGAQVMQEINKSYPDITILFYFGSSAAGFPRDLAGWVGLLPAFIDGMLAEAKPGMALVDGFEGAYGFRTTEQYAGSRKYLKETALKGSSQPQAFREHVQAGFSLWPDNWSGSPKIGRKSFSTDDLNENYYNPGELAYVEHEALSYSDKYVWMWAESLNVWQRWAYVYDKDGNSSEKPVPDAFINALSQGREASVPQPVWRPVPSTQHASVLGPTDDQTVFGDLWDTYSFITDLPLRWRFQIDPKDAGVRDDWASPDYVPQGWKTLMIKEIWDAQGFGSYTGYAWYRTWFKTPALPAGKHVYLAFGAVDELGWVYVNGHLAGQHLGSPEKAYNQRFLIDVTRYLKPNQRNLIAVRVHNSIGVGGIWRNVKLIAPK